MEGVGDKSDRRGVHDDEVVAGTKLVEEGLESGRLDEFRGIGRHHSGGGDVESVHHSGRTNEVIHRDGRVHEIGCELSAERQSDVVSQNRFANVEPDEDDPFAQQGQGDGGVEGNERFAFAIEGRGDEDNRAGFVRQHELHVGSDGSEHLRRDGVGLTINDYVLAFLVHNNLAEEGRFDYILELLAVLDFIVEIVEQEDDDQRDTDTKRKSNKEYHRLARSNRTGGGTGLVHDLGRHDRRGQREGILFAFLVEVDEEFLLDFLLTLDLHVLTFFGRHLTDDAVVLLVLAANVVFGDDEALFVVADRGDDTSPKLPELVVQLVKFGVVLSGGASYLHSIQQQRIVLMHEGRE